MVATYRKLEKKLITLKKVLEILKTLKFITSIDLMKVKKKVGKRYLPLMSFKPFFDTKYYEDKMFKNIIVLPIAEDRGSCGAHNKNVLEKTKNIISFLSDKNKNIYIYCVGKKSKSFFSKLYKQKIFGYFLSVREIKHTIDNTFFLVQKCIKQKFDCCYIVFNRFISISSQRPVCYELCSYSIFYKLLLKKSVEYNKKSLYFNSILEKSVINQFLFDLYTFSLCIFFLDSLENNKCSFIAARYNSMENAVQNTTELVERTTISYNRARQDHITSSIIEVIAAREAILGNLTLSIKPKENIFFFNKEIKKVYNHLTIPYFNMES